MSALSRTSRGWQQDQTAEPRVLVYGTNWCAQTMAARRMLERLGVPYRYLDIERDGEALSQVRWWTGGYASHPTLYIDGEVLVEPTMREMQAALAQHGLV